MTWSCRRSVCRFLRSRCSTVGLSTMDAIVLWSRGDVRFRPIRTVVPLLPFAVWLASETLESLRAEAGVRGRHDLLHLIVAAVYMNIAFDDRHVC
jgi:hypothetical protein